jgi:multidrug efflux system outer membrane protein
MLVLPCWTLVLTAGCAVGPDYKRPIVDVPPAWRIDYRSAASTANTAWWEGFQDPRLNELIQIALQENRDLRIATLRVDEFRAQVQITKSGFFPQLGYSASAIRDRMSENRSVPLPKSVDPTNNEFEIGASMNWELDIWGRLRRANEAARADLLSVEENQRAVLLTLVSDVATTYIQLLNLDKELEISRKTLASRAESLKLSEDKYDGGVISKLELAQIRALYEEASAAIPVQERQIAVLENALSVLLGRNPGPIERGRTIDTLAIPPVPQGLPSELLTRRPDIRAEEQLLVAANARIGIAKSEYFPTISLTGLFGYASTDLGTLLHGPSEFGTFAGASILGPIFTGGRVSGDVARTEAIQKEALESYRKTIQTAFQEVDDALVSNQKSAEQLAALGREVSALHDYADLARQRYEGGYSSYIEVLYAERSLYDAEIAEAESRRDVYTALIAIYKAMGGGWPIDKDPIDSPASTGTDVTSSEQSK